VAEECKEGGYRERFVTARNDLEVYRMPVIPHRQKRSGRINVYHEKNANDTVERLADTPDLEHFNVLSLLVWFCVIDRMHED